MIKTFTIFLCTILIVNSTYLCQSSYSNTKLLTLTQNYNPIQYPSSFSSYQYSDRTFLNRDVLGDGSKWVYPTSQSIYQTGWTASYTSTFTSSYNQQIANFRIAATGTYYVYLNDVLVQTLPPYPKINTIPLRLSCGTNNIRVQVYNCVPSPIAVVYSLNQGYVNTNSCYSNSIRPLAPTYSVCIPRSCSVGYSWNSSKCGCVASYQCLARPCTSGCYWSYSSCSCLSSRGTVNIYDD